MIVIPNLDAVDLLLPNATESVNLIASRVQDGARKSKRVAVVRTIGDPILKKQPKQRQKRHLPKVETLLLLRRKHRYKKKRP